MKETSTDYVYCVCVCDCTCLSQKGPSETLNFILSTLANNSSSYYAFQLLNRDRCNLVEGSPPLPEVTGGSYYVYKAQHTLQAT